MIVIENGEILKLKHPVITTGTFDGLHLGHQKVIAKTISIAKQKNGTPVIFTFWPHPRHVLGKGSFNLLNTLEEKRLLMSRLGVEYVYCQTFTKDFANLSSEEYIKNILVDKIGVKTLVVGYDHQFGKERTGKFDTLGEFAKQFGFELHKVEALDFNGLNVSSTKIRNALEIGDINQANKMLGYDYFISGTVVEGLKIGRTIGFPTANIKLNDDLKLLPSNGVYAAYAELDGIIYSGMLNIGFRPTIDNKSQIKTIEINLFNFSKDIYNMPIRIYFIKKLRDEIKFNGLEELTNQLKHDKEDSQKLLLSIPKMPDSLI